MKTLALVFLPRRQLNAITGAPLKKGTVFEFRDPVTRKLYYTSVSGFRGIYYKKHKRRIHNLNWKRVHVKKR